jgi:hypothetical protein
MQWHAMPDTGFVGRAPSGRSGRAGGLQATTAGRTNHESGESANKNHHIKPASILFTR